MKVLIIEDNAQLAVFIKDGMLIAGIESDVSERGEDALELLSTQPYNLIVLDLGLPDMDGMDVLKSLRNKKIMTPVLILTAREGLKDRVAGLNNGADDYLMKPFAMDELVARTKALLRRPGHALGQLLTAGNITFDTISREILINGQVVIFNRREADLLERLLRRTGRVIPKKALEENLYSIDDEGSSNSIEQIVSRLRKKLEIVGSTATIHTLRGIGYLLSEQEKMGGN